jgi:rhodanese-related sulfurtransferase
MVDILSRPTFWVVALIVLGVVLAIVAVAFPRTATASGLTTVSVEDLHAAVGAGALVLDVREPHEYAEGHVEGSVLVPLATVAARAGEFDPTAPVYVFCRSGNRSLAAAQTLVAAGYRDVRNVAGGMIAWAAAGLPIAR